MTREALGALVFVLVVPWLVDFGLFLAAVKLAGKKAPLTGVAIAYVLLNVIAPLALVVLYMGDDWVPGIALIILVRVVEFGFFSLHDSFRLLWINRKTPGT